MWDGIGESLKIFFEKHLIPTVISGVSAIGILLVLPNNYWMIAKLGQKWFAIFVAGIVFLLVKLLTSIYHKFQETSYTLSSIKRNTNAHLQQFEENLEQYLSFVDQLPPDDREMIMRFIHNNNTPIVDYSFRSWNPESILNTNAVVTMKNKDGSQLVKLDERFYTAMKEIYEKRGSISHF